MGSFAFVLLTFCLQLFLVSSDSWECADYFWRDYHGSIPSDAVPAGKDHSGKTVYVGLAYIRGFELLPATILPQQKVARTTAYASVLDTTQHVKILCSPQKNAFQWLSIQSKDLHEYTNRLLIPGGSEVGESLYIGRVFRNNDAIVGKIFRHELGNRGIWFPLDNHPANSLTYEILSYDCSKEVVPHFNVDVRIGEKKNDTLLSY